ncbi:hypothetical protein HRH25_21815 [Flavisolibacter sp. BT320]|nr:hypothetical protein [Flavisolibacter longurius]
MVTRPNGNDWYKFINETEPFLGDKRVRVGEFVIWDRDTGEVWVRAKVDGKDSKGTSLFKETFWISK